MQLKPNLSEAWGKIASGNSSIEDFIVEALRSIAELITYGDQHDSSFFEFFMELCTVQAISKVPNPHPLAVSGPALSRFLLPKSSLCPRQSSITRTTALLYRGLRFTDRDKLLMTVGGATALAAGIYTTRKWSIQVGALYLVDM